MPALWRIQAPNSVRMYGFKDTNTGQIITNATITGHLMDHNKNASIVGSVFPIPIAEPSVGYYAGVSPILALPENEEFWLEIIGKIGAAVIYTDQFEVVAGFGPPG